jgi:hypothetical protein
MKKLILVVACIFSSSLFSQNSDNELDFKIIENVPLHPNCSEEANNFERKKCMSIQISKLVEKKFDTRIATNVGLSGKVKILVAFKINETGTIVGIKARAPHKLLEQEAIRVIKLLPKFTPGYQKGIPVTVPYSLPIIFDLEEPIKALIKKKPITLVDPDVFPVFRNCKENLGNDYLKGCTTEKIINFIKVSFDTELASDLFPQEQYTKFKVEFVVNKKGKVEQVNAKANHRAVAAEAIRVLKRMPKFKKPGYSNGQPVDTPFSIIMKVYFQDF